MNAMHSTLQFCFNLLTLTILTLTTLRDRLFTLVNVAVFTLTVNLGTQDNAAANASGPLHHDTTQEVLYIFTGIGTCT